MTAEKREFVPFKNKDIYPGAWTHKDEDEIYFSTEEKILAFIVGDPEISGKAYAWGKTANFINSPHLTQAYRETKGPFVAIDLCSALPITAQIYREDFNEDRFYSARSIVTGLIHRFQEIQAGTFDKDFPAFSRLEPEEKENLISALTSQEKTRARRTLTVATQKLLTHSRLDDQPAADPKTEHAHRAIFLTETFRFSQNVWDKLIPLSIFPPAIQEDFSKFTLESLLKKSVGGKNPKGIIIEIASYLARKSMRLRRPFATLSLDIENPTKITDEGENSFPSEFKSTEFYEKAQDMKRLHVRGDILALPFQPESLSFISCVEGYPFYFSEFSLDKHIRFAQSVIDVLKPGGRAVFFPWHFINQIGAQEGIQKSVETYWRDQGMKIVKIRHPAYLLEQMMGEREKALAVHSPLFTKPYRRKLTSFIVIKPKDFGVSQEGALSKEKGASFE